MLVVASGLYVAFNHSLRVWLVILTVLPLLLGAYFAATDTARGTGSFAPAVIYGAIVGVVIISVWTIASWILTFLIGRCHIGA